MKARAVWLTALGVVATLVPTLGPGAGESQAAGEEAEPPPGTASGQTYRARWAPGSKLTLDGRPNEPVWNQAAVERWFVFPWKQAAAPVAEFRALCDETNLDFAFGVPASLGWLEFVK